MNHSRQSSGETEHEPRGIVVLGSTGSIGVSTLDVVARYPEKFKVVALTANIQADRLFEQCCIHEPEYAVINHADAASDLETKLENRGLTTQVLFGQPGLLEVVKLAQVDAVMAAIVGAAGLLPSLAAAKAGKLLLLANKEALVMSGALFMDAVTQNNAQLLPIDSEHNAIFQCMPARFQADGSNLTGDGLPQYGVKRILLTASGGPFRNTQIENLSNITPDQACAHPKWEMGRKISVDSATMMNKGLEVIEACWLFDTGPDNIEVVVHPQSVIHSMVEYVDGSVLAQLGNPDMRTPIANALGWPNRIESGVKSLNLIEIAKLEFEQPDHKKFPCINLAYQAINIGGTAPAVLNAANEIAVDAFLTKKLAFLDIARVVENTLENVSVEQVENIEQLLLVDSQARQYAMESVAKLNQEFRASIL